VARVPEFDASHADAIDDVAACAFRDQGLLVLRGLPFSAARSPSWSAPPRPACASST
jgi:hypothetical protein